MFRARFAIADAYPLYVVLVATLLLVQQPPVAGAVVQSARGLFALGYGGVDLALLRGEPGDSSSRSHLKYLEVKE